MKIKWFLYIFVNMYEIIAKPNIVLMLFDDLGWGVLSQDNKELRNNVPGYPNPRNILYTPNIDRLTLIGKQFKRAYAPSSICAPSRSSILRGLRTDQIYTRDNNVDHDMSNSTIPTVLKSLGYSTIKWGKNGLGSSRSRSSPKLCGYDQFVGYNTDIEAHSVYPISIAWYNNTRKNYPINRYASLSGCNSCVYASDIFLEEFTKYINKKSMKSSPFYAELSLTQPHVGTYNDVKIYKNIVPSYGIYRNKPWTSDNKGFAGQIAYIDYAVGIAYNAIKKVGIENNTLFIITSDNGAERKFEGIAEPIFFQETGGLRMYKRFMLEGGVRVPFIAVWPGTIEPGVSYFPINLYDLKNTFSHLAGNNNTIIKSIDGPISFLNILLNKNNTYRKYMSMEYCPGNIEKKCKWAFYKTSEWDSSLMKLVYDGPGPYNLQLYNLTEDEAELHNLITDVRYKQLIYDMNYSRNINRISL